MKQCLVFALMIFAVACSSSDEKKQPEPPKQTALTKTGNSDAFNVAFTVLMDDYYHLKDNFITESDTIINYYANKLMKDADSLPMAELKADSAIVTTAKSTAAGVSAEIKGLLGEKNLEGKRKSFALLSEEMYDLVRTVQYDKAIVYHDHCPMAFNGNGANWLSNSSDIKNPYIPKKMLTCGEVTDSLNFAKK